MQFIRFIAIGIMNTGVDFFALNILILLFGLGEGHGHFTLFKVVSFMCALINSFIWNKKWVFPNNPHQKNEGVSEVVKFTGVSLLSLVVNMTVATFTYRLGFILFPELSPIILANISALVGSAFSFTFNFLGYKYLVFKFKKEGITVPF